MSHNQRDYEVGRGKPPMHSRFKKGQSGNPRGPRPKHLPALLVEALDEPVVVTIDGERREITKRRWTQVHGGVIRRLEGAPSREKSAALCRALCHPGEGGVKKQALPGSEPQSSPSPRSRGEGWGEGCLGVIHHRAPLPLNRNPRLGMQIPTSPRKRGEVAARDANSFTCSKAGIDFRDVGVDGPPTASDVPDCECVSTQPGGTGPSPV